MTDEKREDARKPPKGGPSVADVRQQQHTGNHPERQDKERPYGADEFGGTRAGAENVEPRSRGGKER